MLLNPVAVKRKERVDEVARFSSPRQGDVSRFLSDINRSVPRSIRLAAWWAAMRVPLISCPEALANQTEKSSYTPVGRGTLNTIGLAGLSKVNVTVEVPSDAEMVASSCAKSMGKEPQTRFGTEKMKRRASAGIFVKVNRMTPPRCRNV